MLSFKVRVIVRVIVRRAPDGDTDYHCKFVELPDRGVRFYERPRFDR